LSLPNISSHDAWRRSKGAPDPDVARRPGLDAGKRLAGNTDDGERASVERDRRTDDAGVVAETAMPEARAEDTDEIRAVVPIIVWRDQTPLDRCHA
jgi:hypothetical protein